MDRTQASTTGRFEMTYAPKDPLTFHAPWSERLPAVIYLVGAIAIGAFVVYGHIAPSGSRAFEYIVERDQARLISSSTCAWILVLSAIAAVLRAQMRGVVIQADGIVTREVLSLGWPRVRTLSWSQIDRVALPKDPARPVRLDLWDGTHHWLPPVARQARLIETLRTTLSNRGATIEGHV